MNLYIWTLLMYPVYSRIVGVVELCRHGARTPTHFIKPWDNSTVWPEGPGELIPEGMRQHYLLGVEFRRRYMTEAQILLPTYYQPEIFVFSSDYNRTIMSAQSQIQGLYPSGTGPSLRSQAMRRAASPPIDISDLTALNSTLGMSALPSLTQVIPLHSDSEIRQWALDADGTCNYYSQLIDFKQQPSDALNAIWKEYPDVLQTVMQQMNLNETMAKSQFSGIMDSLTSNRFVNNPYPLGFNESFYVRGILLKNRLKNFYEFEPDLLARFSGTALLNVIANDLQNMMIGNISQKFFLYSAHDTTIMCALSFLLLNHTENPPFASTLIFELQEYNQEFYVNVKYNDVLQNISSCGGFNCSLYNFVKFVEIRSIPNFYQACQQNMNTSSSVKLRSTSSDSFHWPGHNNSVHLHWYFWLSLGFYIGFAVLLCVVVGFLSRKRSSKLIDKDQSLQKF